MGLLNPDQNYDHLLDVISGYDGMHDLQFKAGIAASESWERGALVSLDAAGDLVAGLAAAHAMPLWAINATGDFDVASDVGNISGGVVATFPATGGYEIATTEFDEVAAPAYIPNALLTAGAVAGEVTAAPNPGYSDVPVVGVVSIGVRTEVYNQEVLQFWPVYQPPVSTGASSS